MTVTVPVTEYLIEAAPPLVIQSCVLAPPPPPPEPEPEEAIFTPVAPGITIETLPVIPEIIDTSPDQVIGCANDVGTDPQQVLNALFPAAISGDGVVDRTSNDFWVYDGTTWNNVGPNPGPTLVVTQVIPPWNEVLLYEARIRTRLLAQSLTYALQLLTEPDPLVVRTRLDAAAITAVKAPSSGTTLSALLPLVSISVTVFAPAASSTITALAPAVISRLAINTPTTNITFSGISPDLVGQFRVRVNPPVLAFELQAIAPSVSTGVAISPATIAIDLFANPVVVEAAIYEVFLSSGTWDWTAAGSPGTVDVLLVGGGGGGGAWRGGGGGAGGVKVAESVAVTGNVTVTVGSGGTGNTGGSTPTAAQAGELSSFGSEQAAGGGFGGIGENANNVGGNGGSGGGAGGAGVTGAQSPGTGTSGQGSNGGNSFNDSTAAPRAGGGGGGKAAAGQDASSAAGGNGGDGVTLASLGFDESVALGAPSSVGGGGGGSSSSGTSGAGGTGGGGGGNVSGNATSGTANTGGGGGGAGGGANSTNQGGSGGSGLVIVRWKL
jgi:hypothetical protein